MKYLGLDVGGTAIKYALLDENIKFYEKGEIPTPYDSFEGFIGVIEELYKKYNYVEGIAISLPGRIDSDSGFSYSGGSLTYNSEKNIAEIIENKLGIKVSIENDGKCAALAEA